MTLYWKSSEEVQPLRICVNTTACFCRIVNVFTDWHWRLTSTELSKAEPSLISKMFLLTFVHIRKIYYFQKWWNDQMHKSRTIWTGVLCCQLMDGTDFLILWIFFFHLITFCLAEIEPRPAHCFYSAANVFAYVAHRQMLIPYYIKITQFLFTALHVLMTILLVRTNTRLSLCHIQTHAPTNTHLLELIFNQPVWSVCLSVSVIQDKFCGIVNICVEALHDVMTEDPETGTFKE